LRLPTVDRKKLSFIIPLLILLAVVFIGRKQLTKFVFRQMKVAAYFQDLQRNRTLKKELIQLKTKIVELNLALSSCQSLKRQNQRLRQMLGLKRKAPYSLVAAAIVGQVPSSWRRIVFLDKGKSSGIQKGDVVLDTQANLLGRIVKVSEGRSQAILIYDPDFKIKVSLDNLYALAEGSLWRGMSLKYIPYDVEIKLGDEAFYVSEGKEEWRVKVGKVSFVYKDENSLTQEVFLEPYASAAEREVFVAVK